MINPSGKIGDVEDRQWTVNLHWDVKWRAGVEPVWPQVIPDDEKIWSDWQERKEKIRPQEALDDGEVVFDEKEDDEGIKLQEMP